MLQVNGIKSTWELFHLFKCFLVVANKMTTNVMLFVGWHTDKRLLCCQDTHTQGRCYKVYVFVYVYLSGDYLLACVCVWAHNAQTTPYFNDGSVQPHTLLALITYTHTYILVLAMLLMCSEFTKHMSTEHNALLNNNISIKIMSNWN